MFKKCLKMFKNIFNKILYFIFVFQYSDRSCSSNNSNRSNFNITTLSTGDRKWPIQWRRRQRRRRRTCLWGVVLFSGNRLATAAFTLPVIDSPFLLFLRREEVGQRKKKISVSEFIFHWLRLFHFISFLFLSYHFFI